MKHRLHRRLIGLEERRGIPRMRVVALHPWDPNGHVVLAGVNDGNLIPGWQRSGTRHRADTNVRPS